MGGAGGTVLSIVSSRHRRWRSPERGQGMIEVALLLPVLIVVFMLTFDAEWSIFQAQGLHDASAAAVRAALVVPDLSAGGTDQDLAAATPCDARILNAVRQAAGITSIPNTASLCIPPINNPPSCTPPGAPAVDHSNVLLYCDGNLSICITADPTVYAPSHVTAVVKDHISGLSVIPLFAAKVTSVSESTTGPTGIPGTASQAQPDPICPN